MIAKALKHNILIVDDDPVNIDMLGDVLLSDYEVSVATNGFDAIEIASSTCPELILLDVMMPEMDGYEVCRRLQADKRTDNIPVIFITAKSAEDDERKGLELGAVDYITKPFSTRVVNARIKTQLELKKHRDILKQQADDRAAELIKKDDALKESLQTIREAEEKLILTERMARLGRLVAGTTHEINTPLGIAITATSHLNDLTKKLANLFNEGKLKQVEFDKFFNAHSEVTHIISSNLNRAAELIRSFKTIAIDQCSGDKRKFRLKEYIEEILISLRPRLRNTSHSITVKCSAAIQIESYPGMFSQIISNLVLNSLTHGFEGMEKGKIVIDIFRESEFLIMRYSDNGKGIKKDYLPQIFDPYFTTKRKKGGSGLGLHIVYTIVSQSLGGEIECKSRAGKGVVFVIKIPIEK